MKIWDFVENKAVSLTNPESDLVYYKLRGDYLVLDPKWKNIKLEIRHKDTMNIYFDNKLFDNVSDDETFNILNKINLNPDFFIEVLEISWTIYSHRPKIK